MISGTCPQCRRSGELGAPCPSDQGYCFASESQLQARQAPLLGHVVDKRFAIHSLLGKGGMGWVFEAQQLDQARSVALKVLRSDYNDDATVRDRFLREAKILSKMQHPNLVAVYSDGAFDFEDETMLYIAMELLRGRTFGALLQTPAFLSATRLLAIARGIAAGLAEAHRMGVVHRDLKPENVLLVRDEARREQAKLVDFGIARLSMANTVLTRTGMVFGTPSYMSPEQATGEREVGPAADVYAFGVLLYRSLTGALPFSGENPLQILMAHVNKPPPPLVLREGLQVPGSLVELCHHCLQKDVAARPAHGGALVEALDLIAVEAQEERALLHGAALPVGEEALASLPPGSEDPTIAPGEHLGGKGQVPNQQELTRASMASDQIARQLAEETPSFVPEEETWALGGDMQVQTTPELETEPSQPHPVSEPISLDAPIAATSTTKLRRRELPKLLLAVVFLGAVLLVAAALLWLGDDDGDSGAAAAHDAAPGAGASAEEESSSASELDVEEPSATSKVEELETSFELDAVSEQVELSEGLREQELGGTGQAPNQQELERLRERLEELEALEAAPPTSIRDEQYEREQEALKEEKRSIEERIEELSRDASGSSEATASKPPPAVAHPTKRRADKDKDKEKEKDKGRGKVKARGAR
ncbi:MAG: serine/threonine-protein kinase [Myxococcota bacterium]|jgi:serine/threonine protein kinase|nr:serine/threonine-protein kinase [Myxococcota bacterium]